MNDYHKYKVQFITYSAFVFGCTVKVTDPNNIFSEAMESLDYYCRMTKRDPNDFHLQFVMEIPK